MASVVIGFKAFITAANTERGKANKSETYGILVVLSSIEVSIVNARHGCILYSMRPNRTYRCCQLHRKKRLNHTARSSSSARIGRSAMRVKAPMANTSKNICIY